jgi:NAD(P)-dependent dehydrogenase (short-subunit alcohol dehydrogenase family)
MTETNAKPTNVIADRRFSRGIGHATVKRFSSAGWRVITCSRHSFPENCPWEAGPEDHIQVDLANPARTWTRSMKSSRASAASCMHSSTMPAFRRRARRQARLGTIETQYEDLAARVSGEFLRTDHAGARPRRGIAEAAKGSVVNVTSIAGSRVHPFAGAAYATSKAALPSLTREMAADFGPRGIRVNAIAPGEIDTAILSPGTEKIVEQIPLRRLGTPDEVAKIIYVLCTETSSYLSGAEIHINGGQHVF